MLDRISAKIIESAEWKTLFFTVIPIVIGVLSGTFVFEITTPSGLDWASFYRTWSFYGLLGMVAVTYLYNRAAYLYEVGIDRFLDDDYCRAYMRSKCLPEVAERYRLLIREGEHGELTQAMKEFQRILR